MKFNINLDWAVITSIFTLFLFWCGYWYFSGFASFYNYEIDIFNLPLSQLLITGLTIGVNYVVYLICILIGLSFLISIDKNHWNYIFFKFIIIILNIWLLFYYLYDFFRKSSSTNNNQNFIKHKLQIFFYWLKPKIRGTVRLDILLGIKVQKFLKKHKLTTEELKKRFYKDSKSETAIPFEFAMFVHYILIIVLIIALSMLFIIGKNQSKAGYDAAKKQFDNYQEMTKVITKDTPKKDLRTTKLCFNGLCLITDKDKNVQIYEMKDIKVMNPSLKR